MGSPGMELPSAAALLFFIALASPRAEATPFLAARATLGGGLLCVLFHAAFRRQDQVVACEHNLRAALDQAAQVLAGVRSRSSRPLVRELDAAWRTLIFQWGDRPHAMLALRPPTAPLHAQAKPGRGV